MDFGRRSSEIDKVCTNFVGPNQKKNSVFTNMHCNILIPPSILIAKRSGHVNFKRLQSKREVKRIQVLKKEAHKNSTPATTQRSQLTQTC